MKLESSYSVCFFVSHFAGQSLSTLATNSLSGSQEVTVTLVPTSLPTESSPEWPSFTATIASLNVSAMSLSQTHQSAVPTLPRPSSTDVVTSAELPPSLTSTSVPFSTATASFQQSLLLIHTSSVNMSQRQSYVATVVSGNLSATLSSQSYSPSDIPVVTTDYTVVSSSLQQSTSEHSKLSTLVTAVKSSQNQSFTTTAVYVNKSATSSVLVQSSSKVPVVTTSYMALSVTPRSSTLGQRDSLTLSAVSSQSPRFTELAATGSVSGPLSPQIFSSSEVSVQPTSYMALSSTLSSIPFRSSLDESNSLMQTASVASGTSPTPSSPVHPLLTANTSVETSSRQSYTTVSSVNVSQTPSSKISHFGEFTALTKISSTIKSSVSGQTVELTRTSRLGTSQSQTFLAKSVLTASTAAAPSVNLSMKTSSQMAFSSEVTISATSYSPIAQSSSVAVVPPGTFVRFIISVPLNETLSRANLTRGIITVYENGTLDGMRGNVSVNVSERKNSL